MGLEDWGARYIPLDYEGVGKASNLDAGRTRISSVFLLACVGTARSFLRYRVTWMLPGHSGGTYLVAIPSNLLEPQPVPYSLYACICGRQDSQDPLE